jgi:uncharacterized protein (TIGR03067 family)
MKRLLLLLVMATTALSDTAQQEDPAQKELLSLLGTWKLVTFENDRQCLERRGIEREFDKQAPQLILHIEGDMVRLGEGDKADSFKLRKEGKPREGTFHVNPTASPKRLELSMGSEGGLFGGTITFEGVYRLKQDQLEICVAWTAHAERPVDFTMKPGVSWRWRLVYERVKSKGPE